jgi:hypothetical protein
MEYGSSDLMEELKLSKKQLYTKDNFANGQWRHSDKCKEFTNKDCEIKTVKN